jgi:predicted nucleic acid-binding protein
MEVVDSSVIINAALGHDRDSMDECRDAVVRSRHAIAHTLAESYSALTRSPLPFRLSPAHAWRLLDEAFPRAPLTLSGDGYRRVLRLVSQQGIVGGAIYDCLIGQTAVEHHATLVSRDRRAMTHYALVGANFTLI